MNKIMRMVRPLNDSKGVTAVVVALFLTVLLAMGAAAIDIGHALVAKNELQNVSDAGALAGTRALGIIYEGMTPAEQQAYVLTSGDQATIIDAVQQTAVANSAAGVPITVDASDIAILQQTEQSARFSRM
jgi:Flp pilus assembly protein TadG